MVIKILFFLPSSIFDLINIRAKYHEKLTAIRRLPTLLPYRERSYDL